MKQDYFSIRRKNFILSVKHIAKYKRINYLVKLVVKIVFGYFYYKIFKSSRTFKFQGKLYNYFYHLYHATWINERTVEVPIIWSIVKKYKSKNILEVGNVLSHYYNVNHDVLDKYEKGKSVINQDVSDFRPSKKYDLIVSISTLEHIGWDETPRKPHKILLAVKNLKRCLSKKGKIVVTLPLGQNFYMDELFRREKLRFAEKYYLKRISEDNRWTETNYEDIRNAKYNSPFVAANGVLVGIIRKN